MSTIYILGLEAPDIMVNGRRFIPITDVAKIFMSDEIAIKEYIAEHSDDFVGHVIETGGEIALDWDAICKINFIEIYSSAVAAIMDILGDELK